jgi:hypothetical protein
MKKAYYRIRRAFTFPWGVGNMRRWWKWYWGTKLNRELLDKALKFMYTRQRVREIVYGNNPFLALVRETTREAENE